MPGNLPLGTRVSPLRKTRGGPGARVSGQPGAPAESDASEQHGGDSLERCPSELRLGARAPQGPQRKGGLNRDLRVRGQSLCYTGETHNDEKQLCTNKKLI
ncbi:unnamed protein product [Rangifer tarandus platyrhynchus]|uniref:Uncharacterized protein n=1 Tax=Rangifer tarandus platyrhynchus TaxID=3082113 RepID=A0AC59YDW3_RANTA